MAHYLISEASRRLHVEAHVLRYWEEELQLEIPRNELGHRYYTEKQLALFQRIKELKELGYQLKAIRTSLHDEEEQEAAEEAGFFVEDSGEEELPFTILPGQKTGDRLSVSGGGRDSGLQETKPGVARGNGQGSEGPVKPGGAAEDRQVYTVSVNRQDKQELSDDRVRTGETAPAAEGSQSRECSSAERTGAEPAAASDSDTGGDKLLPFEVSGSVHAGEGLSLASPEKLEQFQNIMTEVMAEALRRNHEEFSRQVGGEISDKISDKVAKEMNCIMRDREEREEERYRKLDETIRACQRVQKQKREAAATRVPERRRKRLWGRKK